MNGISKCVLCGSQGELKSQVIACGSQTEWELKDKKGNVRKEKSQDDIVCWDVPLCNSCLSNHYKDYLTKSIRDNGYAFLSCLLAIAIGIGSISLADTRLGPGSSKLLWAIFLTAGVLIGFSGLIAAPIFLYKFLYFRKLKWNFDSKGEIISQEVGGTFIDLGNQILINKRDPKYEGFDLPVYTEKPIKAHNDKTYSKKSQRHLILGSGLTFEEAIPIEWLGTWETKRKPFGEDIREKLPDRPLQNFYIYWAVATLALILTSGIFWKLNYLIVSKLLITPVSFIFLAITYFSWKYVHDKYKIYNKMYPKLKQANWKKQFWINSTFCLLVVIFGSIIFLLNLNW